MHVQVGMDPETDRRLTNQSLLCISTQFGCDLHIAL